MCLFLGVIALTQVAGLEGVTNALIVVGAEFLVLGLLTMKGISLGGTALPTFCMVALLTLYGILSIATLSIEGLLNTVQIGAAAAFFLFFYLRSSSTATDFRYIQAIATTFALLCAMWGRAQGLENHNTISGTAIYLVLLGGIPWLLSSARPIRAAFGSFLLVVVVSVLLDHRTGIALGLGGFLVFLLLRFFPFRLVQLLAIGLVAIVLCVPLALFTGIGDLDVKYYDNLMIEWFGRRASSGRQIIWPLILHSVSGSRWLGLGPGTAFQDLYPIDLSASNYYLQTYMQVGLVGLTLFVLLLVSLWFAVGRPQRHDSLGCYVSAVVAIVIVHSVTETFLMQSNLVVGVIAWAVLGLGVGTHARLMQHPSADTGTSVLDLQPAELVVPAVTTSAHRTRSRGTPLR